MGLLKQTRQLRYAALRSLFVFLFGLYFSCFTGRCPRISILRNSIMRKTRKVCALCLAAASMATIQADSDENVTAAQVNGTWKTKYSEFKIWALVNSAFRSNFRAFTNTKRRKVQARTRAKAMASRQLRAIPLSSNPRARKRNAASH